jgi:pyruvate dehydrogenase (quinone)
MPTRFIPELLGRQICLAPDLCTTAVLKTGELEDSVRTWLSQPGPALLHVKVTPMQLVTPPSPFVAPEAVVGMAVYSAKAMLQGKGHNVWEMIVENIP